MSEIPPVRREVIVDAPPDLAFDVFTAEIGSWWPLGLGHSVYGANGTVAFDGGRIVERSHAGETAVWGSVTTWEPPNRVAFTWHPGREESRASAVDVTFTPAGEQTLVSLVHSGWEAFSDPAAAREDYNTGWVTVMREYVMRADRRVHGDGATWVALMHTPGPGAQDGVSVFEQPAFRKHVDFLQRMHARGLLVAAGPLADDGGAGMTVLRLPGDNRIAEAERLARQDDESVADGFFDVVVRPWRVMLSS